MSELLKLAVTGGLSSESLHEDQEAIFVNYLKTTDMKEAMLDEIVQLVDEKKKVLLGLKKFDSKIFGVENDIKELCNVYLMIQIRLSELDAGLEYFFNHVRVNDSEIALYRALEIMDWFADEEMWIATYQYGVTRHITPRRKIQEEYNELILKG